MAFLCFEAVKYRLELLEAAVWEREERKREGEGGEGERSKAIEQKPGKGGWGRRETLWEAFTW